MCNLNHICLIIDNQVYRLNEMWINEDPLYQQSSPVACQVEMHSHHSRILFRLKHIKETGS